MYSPSNMKMKNISEAHEFISEFGFGVIVSASLTGTHIPFVLHCDEGDCGVLYAHCARANPHWKELESAEVLIIFTGPHSYISPRWYAHSPAVPTWNYAAVHAYGKATLLNSGQTLEVVEEVVQKYDPALLIKRDIMTHDLRNKLLSGVVGFKITLTRLEGVLKLGQHRKVEDQKGVYKALVSSPDLSSQMLAQYMLRRVDK